MTRRLPLGIVLLAGLAPWVALCYRKWMPMARFEEMPTLVLTLAAFALVGLALMRWDLWLGAFVVYMSVLAVTVNTYSVVWIVLGAVGVVAVRHAPDTLRHVLVASAVGQVAYALVQTAGYDPFQPLLRFPHGTFGNPKYLGAFLAIVTPLAPLGLAAGLLVGVVISKSWLAAAAVTVGLLCRPNMSPRRSLAAAVISGIAMGGVTATRGVTLETLWDRTDVWALAAKYGTWGDWVFGHGPGAWFALVPRMQAKLAGEGVVTEMFLHAHSEVVQLWYEGGAIAVLLVAGWVWSQRQRIWASEWRGAFVALGVMSLAMHPFHLPLVAPAAIVVLGLATRE